MVKVRSLLLSTGASIAMTGVVLAADLPVKAPPMVPVVSWTGPYAGVHGGGGWLDAPQTINTPPVGFPSCLGVIDNTTCGYRGSGAVFGGQLGYNLQAGRLVYGVEADVSWSDLKANQSFSPLINPFTHTGTNKVDWLASFRARTGLLLTPETLVYLTGGLALGHINSGWSNTDGFGDHISKTKAGWVAGGGVERKFGRNWTGRLEGLYYDLGRDTVNSVQAGDTYSTKFSHKAFVARAGVSFNW